MIGIVKTSKWPYYFLLTSILFFSGCKKQNDVNDLPKAPIIESALQVTLEPQKAGDQIPENFLGLGYEMRDITDPNYFTPQKTTLINLFNNLGPAVLRIGANSVDKTVWTGQARSATTPDDSITTTDIDRFNSFLDQVQGWKTIFGLNLSINDPLLAANEVQYVSQKLGNKILNFEIGNEPEAYPFNEIREPSYSYNDYHNETDNYFRSIRNSTPGAVFSGPGIVTATDWLAGHAKDARQHISLLSTHFYQMAPSANIPLSIERLLHNENWLIRNMDAWKSVADSSAMPYRVTECNSVHTGGRKGVSDTFAASLWAANMMWILASNKCQGVNFHVGYKADDPYTAFIEENGQFFARPLYYGMLFFKAGSKGKIIPLKLDGKGLKVNAYACVADDGTIYLSIINKEFQTATDIQVHTGKAIHSVAIQRLTAPGISSTDQVTFAGSAVSTDGTFTPAVSEPLNPTGQSFLVNIPPVSAFVAIIR